MLGRLGERKGTYDLIAAVERAVRLNPALTVCLRETARWRRSGPW